jgi:hypothetical protein
MLGVSRPPGKCPFSMPKLLDAPVVAITKKQQFFRKVFFKGLFRP